MGSVKSRPTTSAPVRSVRGEMVKDVMADAFTLVCRDDAIVRSRNGQAAPSGLRAWISGSGLARAPEPDHNRPVAPVLRKKRHDHAEGHAQGTARCLGASRHGFAQHARLAAQRGGPDRDRSAGRSRSRSHRPAKAHGRRLPDSVSQRERQTPAPGAHESVRRYQGHQQDVRLEERRRTSKEARLCARPTAHPTYEPELTLGSGIRCVTGEQFDGGSDLGYNRMNFRWGNVGTFQISPGSHMWQVVNKYYKSKQPVPITVCFGVPPACTLLAGAGFDYAVLPMGCDEIGIAGAVQGTPIRLVKARTVNAMALADSELVLEGYVDPRDRRFETKESEDAGVQGRFHFHPEWAGYMGKAYKAPTFHVTGITMRDPKTKSIMFALGVHTLDDHNIDTTVREAAVYELCNRLQPGIVQNVVIPYCMTDWGGCIIQVKKRHQID